MLRSILSAIILLCSVPASAQLTMTGVGGGFGGAAAVYTGPGDVVSGAVFWIGLRGYSTADVANAANVCLPADSVCADLTLSSGNVVVPASLSTCNITTVICTVKIVYNKGSAGSTLDVSNTTIATRPTFRPAMASNGCTTTALPCILFDGTQFLATTVGPNLAQPLTFSNVAIRTSGTTDVGMMASDNGNDAEMILQAATVASVFAGGSIVSQTQTNNAWHSFHGVFNGASSVMNVDGSSGSTGNAGSGGFTINHFILIGRDSFQSSGSWWIGNIDEGGIWASALSGGNMSSLSSNQHTYWGF